MTRDPDLIASLRSALDARRNGDGGWGYAPGNASRLEPTCWALIAIADGQAAAVLDRWPSKDGLLLDVPGAPPNVAFNALAAVTARGFGHAALADRIVAALVQAHGVTFPLSDMTRQNNQLSAWGWIAGEFSWVEPTSWVLLALRGSPRWRDMETRISDGRRVLLDRVCVTGGWNYGSSDMLGTALRAQVPTTALALLALQNDAPSTAVVHKSVRWLEEHVQQEPSRLALGLAALCLDVYGRRPAMLSERLVAQIDAVRGRPNTLPTAVALCALIAQAEPHSPANALRLHSS